MKCANCGTEIPEGSKFCPNCGVPVEEKPSYEQPPRTDDPWDTPEQPNQPTAPYGGPNQPYDGYQQPYGQQPIYPMYPVQPVPMNWHKFLIYFSLWAGGILNVLTGVLMATGANYSIFSDVPSALIYAIYPGLQACDIVIGILTMAAGAFAICVRFLLAGFKRIGPTCLLGVYAANIVISVLYVVLASAISGMNMMDTQTLASLVTSVVMIAANRVYYSKRATMFCR